MFDHLPVGIGADGIMDISRDDLKNILIQGIDWAIEKGYAWPQDKFHCEEEGRMPDADSRCVSQKAVQRGITQVGYSIEYCKFLLNGDII